MTVTDIRNVENIRLMGRFDKAEKGFNMYWSGSCAEMLVKARSLVVSIECRYSSNQRPYISFEVDGLRSEFFSPLEGVHEYTVFMGMDNEKAHLVRITKECQTTFDGQEVRLLTVATDGGFLPLPAKKRRIEFIGDSITAGEGCRGPVNWSEWLTMMFCCSDNYSRMTADRLKAEYSMIALSGWGVVCGWNNNPESKIPDIYEKTYAEGGAPWDFSFKPDTVVIALGTNDNNALSQPPFTDEKGNQYALRATEEDLARETEAAYSFVQRVSRLNPGARIVWISYFENSAVLDAIRKGVEKAAGEGIDAAFAKVLDLAHLPRGGNGARFHPGIVSHRHIAKELVRIIK